MVRPLRFHPLVAEDLSAATRWYDDISPAIGNRFRHAVDLRLDSVERRAESFGRVENDIRAARIDGFPYLVVFETTEAVTDILGIFHSAADPSKWRGRKR